MSGPFKTKKMAKFIVIQTKWDGEIRQIAGSALIEANDSHEAEDKVADTMYSVPSDPSNFYAFEVTDAWTEVIMLIRDAQSKLT